MNTVERTAHLERIARGNGWDFAPAAVVPACEKFEFPTGEKRKVERIENLIVGADFKCFDIFWQAEFNVSDAFGPLAHKNMIAQNARHQTVLLFESADLRLPKIHIYPTNSGSWLDKMFRQNRESKFGERWTVIGDSADFFNEKVIGFYHKNDGFWTFAVDNLVFIYQPNILIASSEILDWTTRISSLGNILAS